jgi:hypothetical protein
VSKHAKGGAPITEPDFFSWLDPLEHHECRDYLLSQEIVRQQRIIKRDPKAHQYLQTVPVWDAARAAFCPGKLETIVRVHRPEAWLAARVAMIRKAFGLHKNFTSTPVAGSPLWFYHPATRVIVLWPEWPGKPYLEIPLEERLHRIAALEKQDQLTSLEGSPIIGKQVIEKIALSPSLPWQIQVEAFKAELQLRFPQLFQGAPGRKSAEARVLDDLNAFTAHQLCRVRGLPRARVIQLIRCPKGHPNAGAPVYQSPKGLDKVLQRFPHRLQQFWGELMGNLTPLSPDPLGLPPDFTLLA